jgi:hypothetical protein
MDSDVGDEHNTTPPPAPQTSQKLDELVAIPFDLGSSFPGDSEKRAQTRAFLRSLMVEHPKGVPDKTKHDFKVECEQRFGTSAREFDQIWREEAARTGASAWRKPGPRGPHKPRKKKLVTPIY